MKKEIEELQRQLDLTIKFIEQQLEDVFRLDYPNPMREKYAAIIATQLRVLLNDEGRNKSLLGQLGIKNAVFYTTEPSCCLQVVNMLTTARMVHIESGEKGTYCLVNDFKPRPQGGYSCSFDVWWEEIVIDSKHEKLSHISRRDVILVLADKEGGAHVDSDYDEAYRQVKFEHGFYLHDQNRVCHKLQNDFFVESLFYIAQEFLYSYKRFKMIKSDVEYVSCLNKLLKLTYYRQEANKKKPFSERWWFCSVNDRYDTLMYSFDYYQKALYELFDLQIIKAELGDGKFINEYYIDLVSPRRQIVYLRSESATAEIQVLVKFASGYQLLNVMADIYNERKLKTLDECKTLANPTDPHDFDYWLDRQLLEKPE